MFAAILAALNGLAALPKLIESLQSAVDAFKKYQDAQWKEKLGEISSQLSHPMTIEEKQDAAKKLADLIASL